MCNNNDGDNFLNRQGWFVYTFEQERLKNNELFKLRNLRNTLQYYCRIQGFFLISTIFS